MDGHFAANIAITASESDLQFCHFILSKRTIRAKYNRPSFSVKHFNCMKIRRWTSSIIFLQITELLVLALFWTQKYDTSPSCWRPRLGAETAECEAGGQRKWAPSRQPPIKIFHNSVNNIDNGDRHSVYPSIWPSPRSPWDLRPGFLIKLRSGANFKLHFTSCHWNLWTSAAGRSGTFRT